MSSRYFALISSMIGTSGGGRKAPPYSPKKPSVVGMTVGSRRSSLGLGKAAPFSLAPPKTGGNPMSLGGCRIAGDEELVDNCGFLATKSGFVIRVAPNAARGEETSAM